MMQWDIFSALDLEKFRRILQNQREDVKIFDNLEKQHQNFLKIRRKRFSIFFILFEIFINFMTKFLIFNLMDLKL